MGLPPLHPTTGGAAPSGGRMALDQRKGNGNVISSGPTTAEHYNTVYGDTFQDPKNTLGFGAKTKAEKLKKAAVERGTPVPLMVMFETFDDAVQERTSEQPEYGFGRLLPTKIDIPKTDHFLTVAQQGYGGYSKRLTIESKLAKAGELEAAKGRSGARVEHGKGIIDTFKNNANNPQENTLVQASWTYDLDPAIKVKLKYGGKRPTAGVVDGLSLPIGEEVYGGEGSIKNRHTFARTATITKTQNWQESSTRKGTHVFMDDP